MPLSQRQCLFDDEVCISFGLVFFEFLFQSLKCSQRKSRGIQKYNFAACLVECRMNYIASQCKCIPFFYPEFGKKLLPNTKCSLYICFMQFSAFFFKFSTKQRFECKAVSNGGYVLFGSNTSSNKQHCSAG